MNYGNNHGGARKGAGRPRGENYKPPRTEHAHAAWLKEYGWRTEIIRRYFYKCCDQPEGAEHLDTCPWMIEKKTAKNPL